MKISALFCLLILAAPLQAAAPEQRYLELRDRHIAKFAKAEVSEEMDKQHDAAVKELTGVLRDLIGPVAIKGLPAEGQSNVDTLYPNDVGFGHLDGLGFSSRGDRLQAVVTSMGLLKHWLREHRADGMPQEIGAAFRSERFHYQAIQDSAFASYAELPLVKPDGVSTAVAVLGLRGNGDLKGPPDELDVVAIKGDRMFFLASTGAVKTKEIAVCEKVWTRLMAKTTPKDAMDKENQAMAAYTKCFAKEAPAQAWYAAAVKTAQEQLERLPLR